MLTGKTVIVTGSTTGIGKAIAQECIAQGAHVLIHGRDAERGVAVANQLGPNARFHQDDLADPAAANRIVNAALEHFGRIDCLVNNAARVVRSDIRSTSVDLFENVMAINVRAPLLLVQAALDQLQQNQGVVANIGSVNGLGGERNLLAYSISKGALLTLSKNLADALGTARIRFVHFNVGWVLTENEYEYKLADGLSEDWPTQLPTHEIPAGRMTRPEEIANVVTFWLSDKSVPFSGTVMELDQFPFEGRNPTREE